MFKLSKTSESLYSKESCSIDFGDVDDWLSSLTDEKASSTSISNPKLNVEIHLAITTDPSKYITALSDQFFALYRDTQNRPFVLQFLPSFITTYYDVLLQPTSSVDGNIKDVCSTIDTFFIGLYNLAVLDDGHKSKNYEFRIPNLTFPSIYHTPNPDHYAPTPLTQHAISKHEKKREIVRLSSFLPFDSVNSSTRERILWFLLIQYGSNVSFMDTHSRQSFFKMSKKLISQGFTFDDNASNTTKNSILPPTGRRIHLSSRMMSEILGILFYFKANSKDKEASECMHLLKHRAEYEMYADVILMTESMGYLHEFESQRPETQDIIGIEIELPATIDVVKQKRTATTTRSMKNRHRSHKHRLQPELAIAENDISNETIEHLNFVPVPSNASPTTLTPPTSHRHKSIHDVLEEVSPTVEFIRSTSVAASLSTEQQNQTDSIEDDQDETTPMIDTTNISSPIGSPISSPSPSTTRHYKPLSLTSTQTYFKTIQQQRLPSPNVQNVQTVIYNDDDNDSSHSRTSSIKQKEKKDTITTVRFMGTNENGTKTDETYI